MAFFRCGKNNNGGEVEYKVWTVKIDESNSNPLSCCTYADDAVGMTKGSSDWDDIFGYKPCIMKDGVVVGYLNPDNFSKYEDGTTAPITGSNCDTMIEFPRMGLNISKSDSVITVSLTNNPNDENFCYFAHNRGETQKDYFYLGAYLACVLNSQYIYSQPNRSVAEYKTLTNFITYAHNRGTGYEIMGFYQWTYIQALYILKYGNLNSQAALGQGFVNANVRKLTGITATKGMCYGDTSSDADRVKLFGLEDAWGNLAQRLGGICINSGDIMTSTDNFKVGTTVNDYEYVNSIGTSISNRFITKVCGTKYLGFIAAGKTGSGSSTTYYSDGQTISYRRCYPYVGGNINNTAYAGIFFMVSDTDATTSSANVSSRLMYL